MKKLSPTLLLLLCAIFSVAPKISAAEKTVDPDSFANFATAYDTEQQGKCQQALEIYSRLLEKFPADPELHYRIATCLVNIGEEEKAVVHLEKALKNGCGSAENFLTLVRSYRKKNQAAEADKIAEMYFQKNPPLTVTDDDDHLELLVERGMVLLELEKNAPARECFEQSLRIDANHPQAHLQLAKLDEANKDFLTAAEHYAVVRETLPESSNLLHMIVYCCYKGKDYRRTAEEAKSFLSSFEKSSDRLEIAYILAYSQLQLGQDEEAIVTCRLAYSWKELKPGSKPYEMCSIIEARRKDLKSLTRTVSDAVRDACESPQLWETFEKVADRFRPAESIVSYETVLAKPSIYSAPYIKLATLYLADSEVEKAVKTVDRAKASGLSEAKRLYIRGTIYSEAKEPRKALQNLEKSVKLEPADENAVARLYATYRQLKMDQQAEQTAKDFLILKPNSAKVSLLLAEYYMVQEGKLDEALKHLETCRRTEPDNAYNYVMIGRVYLAMHKNKEAEEALQQAIAKDPESVVAWELIASAYSKLEMGTKAADALCKAHELERKKRDAAKKQPSGK